MGTSFTVLDLWTLQSVVGFGGCVETGLDEHLTRQPGLASMVTAALRRIRDRLPAEGTIEIRSPDLARRADRVCEGHSWYMPGAFPRRGRATSRTPCTT